MSIEVLIVASPGGHLNVAKEIFLNTQFRVKYITTPVNNLSGEGVLTIRWYGRNYKILLSFIDAAKIIWKYKPNVIFSSGAGVAIPFFIIGKLMGIGLIFLESASRVHSLSLTGKILKHISNKFYVRDENLSKKMGISID